MASIVQGLHLIGEMLLRFCVHPRLRAACLRWFGARIGSNVRIYECRFINLRGGFGQLHIGDDVHIGTDCLFDLEGPLRIGRGSTISPRVVIMTHSDPGSVHASPWCDRFPAEARGVSVGSDCWVGTGATLLSGSEIDDHVMVGACALVKGRLAGPGVYVGVPARRMAPHGKGQ